MSKINKEIMRIDFPVIGKSVLFTALIGSLYAILEYYISLELQDPQAFFPLIIRAVIASESILLLIIIFERYSKKWFRNRRFIHVVFIRSVVYTFIVSFCLLIMNGIWIAMITDNSFLSGMNIYFNDTTFIINLISIFFILIMMNGELLNYILGFYHQPKEVKRIFCFVDLYDSTSIAEQLGHVKFAEFLKDYYSDITDALKKTKAEVYQYVGDEIVLNWKVSTGTKHNRAISCPFLMAEAIAKQKNLYEDKYGVFPRFKTAMHTGNVMVTWVGEIKKEIVYIGDVLNTTSRILENCKRLSNDFLVSEQLLNLFQLNATIKTRFIEEFTPRGKKEKIKMFGVLNTKS